MRCHAFEGQSEGVVDQDFIAGMPPEAHQHGGIANATSSHRLPKVLPDERLYVAVVSFRIFFHSYFPQLRDTQEGADIIMVKPALPYLDIIQDAVELAPNHPLACYQVSGEFAMIHAGAAAGVYDLRTMAFESVESMVRAGCTLIISYFTPDFLNWLSS